MSSVPSSRREAGSGTADDPGGWCRLMIKLSMPIVAGQSANVSLFEPATLKVSRPVLIGATWGVSSLLIAPLTGA